LLVTCAIILENSRFLLARRPLHKNQGGKWEFPGGKVQEGETPQSCIVREIMEELDLNVTVAHTLEAVPHQYPGLSITLLPLVCNIKDGSLRLHEHTECRWVNLAEAALLDLCEADKKVLSQIAALRA
jgi:8-oxo-dGTP diphosphatase